MKTHIICPNCKKTLKIVSIEETPNDLSTISHFTVIGTCPDCDYDATWDHWYDGNKMTEPVEINCRRYFHG